MDHTNFEEEMKNEIVKRVDYYANNTEIKCKFSKANYICAIAFALFGLILTIIAAN